MKIPRTVRQIDTLAAICLTILSGLCCVFFYTRVSAAQFSSSLFEFSLQPGTIFYSLWDTNGCVGRFKLQAGESDGTLDIKLSGELQALIKQVPIDAKISSNVSFSVLGQLVASFLEISTQTDVLRLASTEIDPIKGLLQLRRGGHQINKEFALPGPLEIRRQKGNTYGMHYHKLDRAAQMVKVMFAQAPSEQLPFEVKEDAENWPACKKEIGSRLELSTLSDQLKRQYLGLLRLLIPGV